MLLKTLTAAVSHRINNLLHLNSGGEFLIDSGLKSKNLEQISQGWTTVRRTQNRINQLLKNMLIYSRDFKPLLREHRLHILIEVGDQVNKDNAEFGMIEMLASRKIVAAQNGTIEFFTEAENLNSIEVRFPIGEEIKT